MYKEIEKNCIDLAKSIIFKVNILPISINKNLEEKGYIVSTDETTWKYYLNISGNKHITNSNVEIILLETGEIVSLSKELLQINTYTMNELKSMGVYYKELINKYPNDIDFIKGCMYPIDIDVAINADEGTVLNYNDLLVENNEINLIPSMESYLKKILYRWKIDNYANYENLYVPSLLSIIYVNLPAFILNLRLKNLNTPYVHSLFMDVYFKSNNIGDEVKYLNNVSRFWLYRNLEYIKHNIGKNSVLEKIIEKIFTLNDVGIAKLNISKELNNDNDIISKNVSISTIPYNDFFDTNDNINTSDIIEKELNTTNRINSILSDYNNIDYEIGLSNSELQLLKEMSEETKVLYLQSKKNYDFFANKNESLIFYWAYMLKNNIFNVFNDYVEPNANGINNSSELRIGTLEEYSDPITNNTYRLNSYTAFLVLVKLLLTLNDRVDEKITTFKYTGIINNDFDINTLNIFDDGYSKDIIADIHSNLPSIPTSINMNIEFFNFMYEYFRFQKDVWLKASNYQNSFITGNLKLYFKSLLEDGELTISDGTKTIDEILADFDIVYEIGDNYDILLSIRTLIETFTIYRDEDAYANKEIDNYRSLLSKLVSYSIQSLTQTIDESPIRLYDNNPTLFISKKCLISILEDSANPLEDVNIILDSYIDDFLDIISVDVSKSNNKVYMMKDMAGRMGIYNNTTIFRNIPVNFISIAKTVDYDILDEEWKDIFIRDFKFGINVLEDNISSLGTIDDETNVQFEYSVNRLPNTIYSMNSIAGSFSDYIMPNFENKPRNFITVLDIPNYDILNEEWKDNYIYNFKLSVDSLEDNNGVSTDISESSLSTTSTTSNISTINEIESVTLGASTVTGDIVIKPKTMIFLED